MDNRELLNSFAYMTVDRNSPAYSATPSSPVCFITCN